MTPAPRETEIKLDLDPADVDAVLACPALQEAGPVAADHLVTTYFDTPDRRLQEAGLVLRVRRSAGRHRQTVKRIAVAAGLFDRDEWEADVEGDEPDRSVLGATPVGAVLADRDDGLVPLFTARIERTPILLRRGEALLDIAVDRGTVEIGEGRTGAPFAEVEIELKEGPTAALFAMARELSAVAPLRLGVTSKAERGFRLLDGAGPRAHKAAPVILDRSGTAAMAFQAVARSCLKQLRLNEPGVLASRDPDCLHQLRVSIRRFRSAITLFKPVVGHSETVALRDLLRERAALLGEARNRDVLLLQTLPEEMERRPAEAKAFLALRARLESERAGIYDAVQAMLQSREWRDLVIALAALVEDGAWLADPALAEARDEPVTDYAARTLEKHRRKVRRRGRHLADLGASAKHAVRIEAKKLRYGAEFFASLAQTSKARRRQATFVAALSDLQDELGALNDAETAHALLAAAAGRAAATNEGNAAFAAGLLAADREHRAETESESVEDAFHRFVKAKRFWEKP